MLAPLGESKEDSPFVPLAVKALLRWPSFVAQLRDQTAVPLKINGPGMLRIAVNEAEEEDLKRTFKWQKSFGLPLEMLGASDIATFEPSLTRNIRRAILSPMEQHVQPRLLIAALTEALVNRNVNLIHNTRIVSFTTRDTKVHGVKTLMSEIIGDNYIIAGGAWSSAFARKLDYTLPVEPVRGQIISYGPPCPVSLAHTVYSHAGYLVPRPDETLLAGATTEYAGFDSSNTVEGIASLKRMASNLLPELTDHCCTTWAGLRPVSKDGSPVIGAVPGWDNVSLATGHGRNGVLLAPLTGAQVADYFVGSVPLPDLFSPLRFGSDL